MPLNVLQENEQLSRRLAAALGEVDRLSARISELEAQRQEFFRRFRHDCMNQLGSISGFLTLLQDTQCGELNARQRRYIQNAGISSQSLLMLIEGIAAANSPEETKAAPEPHEGEFQGISKLRQV